MKKQILFLAFFVLAVVANVNKSYGQALAGTAPRPLSCTDDALHPIAGKEYTYTVGATPAGGQYTWWATKNGTFYDAGGSYAASLAARLTTAADLTAVDAAYGVPSATPSVKITWSSAILSNTGFQNLPAPKTATFVAVHYAPPVGSGCADNFKVFELDPKNGFTVDILNLDDVTKAVIGAGLTYYDQAEDQCFANVSAATYVAPNMSYLYGVNTMYFEVVAANFSGTWTPTFQLSGLQGAQTAVIEWDYTTAFSAPKVVTTGVASATPVATALTNTSAGVSIYVRVTITNNSFEGLADTPITLAVDGTNSVGELDVVNTTCVAPAAADFVDLALQTLKLRPTVVSNPDPFSTLPTNPRLIPKNP